MIPWHEFWTIAAQVVVAVIILLILGILIANGIRIIRNRMEY